MEALDFSTRYLNMNFRFKVNGVDNNGIKLNKLVGVSGLLSLIGADLFNKFVNRAINQGADKCVCKLRRGLKVTLYNK